MGCGFICDVITFQLSLQGYHHKQHIFLQKMIEKLLTFKIDLQRFEILKENVNNIVILTMQSSGNNL